MNKFNFSNLIKILGLTILFATSSQAIFIEGFPSQCAFAPTNMPMVGHVLRIGFVQWSAPFGWIFSFPDVQNAQYLSSVPIAENVGLIGQDPYADFSQAILATTPEGTVALAQIFVGATGMEPLVTCLSQVMPFEDYIPGNYGPDLNWLDRGRLGYWYTQRSFGRNWEWRDRWGGEFSRIRNRYSSYREEHPDRRFGRRIDADEHRRERREIERRRPRDGRNHDRGWRSEENGKPITQKPRDEQRPAERPIEDHGSGDFGRRPSGQTPKDIKIQADRQKSAGLGRRDLQTPKEATMPPNVQKPYKNREDDKGFGRRPAQNQRPKMGGKS